MQRSYNSNYRDPNVTQWKPMNVRFVKLALYKMNEEVAYMVFDARGSDYINWFNSSRVITSSWSDLSAEHSFHIFSVEGYHPDNDGYFRSFHITSEYGGCDGDKGQLAVIEHDGSCDWDHHPTYPQFIYSDMNGADWWNKLMFGRADYLAILVNTE